jgi:hypothetical protein
MQGHFEPDPTICRIPGRVMEAFDIYSPAIDANPFPYYEVLRERYPCYCSPAALGCTLVRLNGGSRSP